MDKRIGKHFLKPSPGFGGSCFQKDILNLIYIAQSLKLDEVADYWKGVIKINNYQKYRLANRVTKKYFNSDIITPVGILGWSFKKNTNDSRESASIFISSFIINQSIPIMIYDPMVKEEKIISDLIEFDKNNEKIINNMVEVSSNFQRVLSTSDLIVILTEWDEFKEIEKIDYLSKQIYDFRNILHDNSSIYYLGKIIK